MQFYTSHSHDSSLQTKSSYECLDATVSPTIGRHSFQEKSLLPYWSQVRTVKYKLKCQDSLTYWNIFSTVTTYIHSLGSETWLDKKSSCESKRTGSET
uniref:Putative ovule protein n=1 Tax=Solanum chacoense TaxID=4108 RepID=A0A0V0HIW6_SOLCH